MAAKKTAKPKSETQTFLLKQQLDQAVADLQAANQRASDASDKVLSLTADLASLQTENSNYREENTDLREKVQMLEARVDERNATVEGLIKANTSIAKAYTRETTGHWISLPFGITIRIRKE